MLSLVRAPVFLQDPIRLIIFFRGLTLCSWSQLRRPYTLQCCTPAQDNTLYWIDHLSSGWWHLNHRLAVVTSEIWYGNKVILKTLGSLPPQLWIFGNLNIWQLNAPSPFVETLKLWKLDARTPSWSLSRHLTSLLTTPWLAQIWEITKNEHDRCFDRSSFFALYLVERVQWDVVLPVFKTSYVRFYDTRGSPSKTT